MPVTSLAGLHGGAGIALHWCDTGVHLHRYEDVAVFYPCFGAGLDASWCMAWHKLCFFRDMNKCCLSTQKVQLIKRVMKVEGGSKVKAEFHGYPGMQLAKRAAELSFLL